MVLDGVRQPRAKRSLPSATYPRRPTRRPLVAAPRGVASDARTVRARVRAICAAALGEEEEDAAWVAAAAEAPAGDQLDRGAGSLRRFLVDELRAIQSPA